MSAPTYPPNEDVASARELVYRAILAHSTPHIVEDSVRCGIRLLQTFPPDALHTNKVFVAYGGGKDSSYMVAFVRLIQLLIFRQYATTFQLRVVTNRHSGMPKAVMENIDRAYKALGLYEDPDVELLLTDGDVVQPFDLAAPYPASLKERSRLDILMTGHRCEGEARPTFCNACNLSMVHSFGIAVSHQGGVDVVITGDSHKEFLLYTAWIHHIAAKLRLPGTPKGRGFGSFLQTVDHITTYYFEDIYGKQAKEAALAAPFRAELLKREPLFFSMYADTAYRAVDHWDLLTRFLGFQFDDIAFSFTESDCANPALMAHLRGLKAERVYDRSYTEGIAEYVQFATHLMEKKDFPRQLIDTMQSRYATAVATAEMRDKMNHYAQDVLDLSEDQIVCMLYSPFAQRGKNLSSYIQKEQPHLVRSLEQIHRLLAKTGSETQDERSLARELTDLAHLDIEHLRTIYSSDLSLHGQGLATPIAFIFSKDPHKMLIQTSRSPGGPVISEIISGR